MNYIQAASLQVEELILKAAEKANKEGSLPAINLDKAHVESPKDPSNGDYASTFAMQSARIVKRNPREIAKIIVDNINLEGSFFSSCEAAGAGFINFRLGRKWYNDVLLDIQNEGDRFGYTLKDKKEKIMVEFVSANPTGPMHMGNARGGVLGDCLAEVLFRAGNEVKREFYVNDAGNQIELFGRSLEARYLQRYLGEDAVEFPEDGYFGDDIKTLAADFSDKFSNQYLNADQTERRCKLISFGLEKNIKKMKEDLNLYRIVYDKWFYESCLHESEYVKETVELLKQRGHTFEEDGALWFKTTDFGCEKNDVLMRANGFYTYFAADIAYHRDKLERRGFDRVINIWGADHHGHVARLKAALDALGLDGQNRLEVVLMQLVRLIKGGEVVRMSKRTGKAISLSDLLSEIPVDAARFFFNSRAADTHLEFDLDLAVRQDSENPVYYVQYAHARIMSIMKNLESEGIKTGFSTDYSCLDSAEELALIKELSRLPEEIIQSAENRDSTRLDRYAVSVASHFHRFYTSHRIKEAEENVRKARIALCLCVKTVISNVLDIIKVNAPLHM